MAIQQSVSVDPGLGSASIPQPAAEPRGSSVDSLADDVLSAWGELSSEDAPNGEPAPKPAPKPKQKAPAPKERQREPEVDDEPEDEEADEPTRAKEDDEVPEEHDEPESTRGSESEPFSIRDLPEDKFLEIKVDGEKLVLPLREIAQGYVREQTFTRRVNQTQMLTQQAREVIEKATAFPEKLRSQFQEFTQDPIGMFEFFFEGVDLPPIPQDVRLKLERGARSKTEAAELFTELAAHLLIQERKTPGGRERREALAEQRRLLKERETLEQQKQIEAQQRQQELQRQQALQIFKPGWEAGLKKAGFPQLTPQTQQQLYDEVMVRVGQRAQAGKPITSEDITDFVLRSVKLLGLDAKPKPKPAVPVIPPKSTAKTQGGKADWSKIPPAKRAKDPDYLLEGIPAKLWQR